MSLMVILSHADPEALPLGASKPKIEWVEGDYWINEDGSLACFKDAKTEQIRVAEFARGQWIGVKLT